MVSTDSALIEKREELKRRLASGEYKTLVDVLYDGLSKMIQKITRNPQPISPWYSSAILGLIIMLLGFAALVLMGDAPAFMRQMARFPAFALPLSLFAGYLNFAILVAGNSSIHRVFTTFHDTVLDAAETNSTVDDFERWLTAVCDRKTHFIVTVVIGTLVHIYSAFALYTTIGLFFPISMNVLIFLVLVNFYAFLYLLLYMVALSARIGRYHLRLYMASPANSEVVSHLSSLLGSFVYLVALFAALITLFLALSRLLLIQLVAVWFSLWWIPIIVMFVLNQSCLYKIIQRAKWRTLGEIQAKVEQLHSSENLGEKETMETINRLMDYHDRINATRNSALDLRGTLNFVNSLLLPLLAFLLGNLDLVLNLFARKP